MVTAGVELLTQVAPTLMVVEQQRLQQRKQSSGNRQRVYGQRRRVGLPLVAESHLGVAPTSTLPPVMTSFILFFLFPVRETLPPHHTASTRTCCPVRAAINSQRSIQLPHAESGLVYQRNQRLKTRVNRSL